MNPTVALPGSMIRTGTRLSSGSRCPQSLKGRSKKLPEPQGPYRGFARMIADHESANFKLSRVNRRILIGVNQHWSAVRIFDFSPCLRASVVDVLPAEPED